MTEVICVLDAKAELGECPVWSADEQALYWVDIYAPSMNRLDPATGENRNWIMPDTIGSFGLRESGGAVVALRDGFHLFDFDTGTIVERIHRGEERVSHVQGRFFIHRLSNVGATGLQRSWTDNLLWHHTTHLIDFGLWMVSGGDMATADARIRNIYSAYPPIEPRTGIPMELALVVETHDDQTIVCTGSYYSAEYIYDTLAVTDRDSYRVNERNSTMFTGAAKKQIASEQENAELIAPDFVQAIEDGRDPAVPGWSVLPAMRVLHRVQSDWDAKHGAQVIPGRCSAPSSGT